MQIFSRISEPFPEDTSVALGAFDGVHLGHRAVISEAVRLAERDGLVPAVFTFSDLPKSSLMPGGSKIEPLSDFGERARLIGELGIRALFAPDFASVRGIGAADFVEKVLVNTLRAKRVVCGEDYRFGAFGAGDAALLERLCREYGAVLTVVPPVTYDGEKISSTLIRSLLREGRLEEAGRLLGRRDGRH